MPKSVSAIMLADTLLLAKLSVDGLDILDHGSKAAGLVEVYLNRRIVYLLAEHMPTVGIVTIMAMAATIRDCENDFIFASVHRCIECFLLKVEVERFDKSRNLLLACRNNASDFVGNLLDQVLKRCCFFLVNLADDNIMMAGVRIEKSSTAEHIGHVCIYFHARFQPDNISTLEKRHCFLL